MTIPANPTNWVTGELATAARLQLIHDWINFFKAPPSCRVKKATSFSVPTGGYTSLDWDQEDWDTDTIHDNAVNNSRLTCKTAGKYAIWAVVSIGASSNGQRALAINVNGVQALETTQGSASALVACSLSIYTELQLAVNDFVQIPFYQNSGGALGTFASLTRAGMTWIGT